MLDLRQTIRGSSAVEIASDIEGAIREGTLAPGTQLPPVRALAKGIRVSPNTVAATYRLLRSRGLVITEGRRGTRVSLRPPLSTRPAFRIPDSVRNLADGNPDPSLFPCLEEAVSSLDLRPRLYGEEAANSELVRLACLQLEDEGIPVGSIAVIGGALDGIERVLRAHLRPGDRIALEDPSYSGVLDLVHSLGLEPYPMEMDEAGPLPAATEEALESGARACVLTPRAQNPTGAALDERRVGELRAVLERFPEVLVIEDDHAGPVAGAPAHSVCSDRSRWAIVRSVAKSLGPDLRLAILSGDPVTVARVEGRQMIGTGWVSNLLQQIVVALWKDPATQEALRRAAETYTSRRTALLEALARRGIEGFGRSGMNVWIPIEDETAEVQYLFDAGWAVAGGERYRIRSRPAIRVTTSSLEPEEAERFADVLARSLSRRTRTRSA
jgi:DNA-binding transcriptional MocR family regulator